MGALNLFFLLFFQFVLLSLFLLLYLFLLVLLLLLSEKSTKNAAPLPRLGSALGLLFFLLLVDSINNSNVLVGTIGSKVGIEGLLGFASSGCSSYGRGCKRGSFG